MHGDESYVLRVLKAGARSYLLKDSAEYDLIQAMKPVSEGKAFFSPAISKMLVEDYIRQMRKRGVEDSYELLTTREREVMQLLAEGESNKDAAALLNLNAIRKGVISSGGAGCQPQYHLLRIPVIILPP
jgi:two-component system, NarL family, response regulator NreC